ncbi:MAG: 1,4-alpha-glucan branching protein GlgB [Oscillospiraceae bacterium]|nr:1,4-alpha-glucan branching protein GlgB [Oscillospiraceae bacterium]
MVETLELTNETLCEEGKLTDYQMYLFNEGTNYYAYKMLGAHKTEVGFRFGVWAPNAKSVSVVGDFNDWNPNGNPMMLNSPHGIWELEIPNLAAGQLYKYYITTKDGEGIYKADPYAFAGELRPGTASMTCDIDTYKWKDGKWKNRAKNIYESPKVIYELHIGSWKQHEDGSFYSYGDLVAELIPYVKQMGFTHIELMPINEYPYDASWGYQPTGYYSVTSRYGTPQDFKYFVDSCHQAGIGVIMDWVPAHFPRDSHGLMEFDGTPLYEYPCKQRGEHNEWGTKVFDYGKAEVQAFLISNAMFWLEEFHIDGLRVDAVSSMLYLDYNRKKGEWKPNENGTNENLDAINFFQNLNTTVFAKYPDTMMIAEESTAWANVTKPTDIGGLGFNFKWNMGWMHDVLKYMSLDPAHRKGNHDKLTFSMHYAFSENYVLPLSHDEVVHGKKSILDKMSGSYEEKFATLRAFYGLMMAHPGAKLIFMGSEFGQFIEWDFAKQLDWLLLDYDAHARLKNYMADLIHFYRETPALWQNDRDWNGYQWLKVDDCDNSVLAFMRLSNSKREKIIAISNFTPVERKNYKFGVPQSGIYKEVFNSNWAEYGGTDARSEEDNVLYMVKKEHCDDKPCSLTLDIPPLTTVFLKKV